MTTFNSDQYQQLIPHPTPIPGGYRLGAGTKVQPHDLGGRVRVMYAHWPGRAGLSNYDRVNLFVLPKGARILHFHMVHGAFGDSVQLDIGTMANPQKYYIDYVAVDAESYTVQLFNNEPLEEDTLIILRFGDLGNPHDAATFDINCAYVVD